MRNELMNGIPMQEVGMNGITHKYSMMKIYYSVFFVTLFSSTAGSFALEARASEAMSLGNIPVVSMVEVLVQPEHHSDRVVTVTGILDIEDRASHIYLHQAAFDHFDTSNNITLMLSSDRRREFSQFHGRYVLVTGRIVFREHASPDIMMSQISRLEPLPSREPSR